MIRIAIAAAVIAVAAAPADAKTASPRTVTAFIQSIYAGYAGPDANKPFFERRNVFHRDLARLMAENRRALGGEVGVIGADPLCDCQDGTPRLVRSTVLGQAGQTVRVAVSLINQGQRSNLTLHLRRDAGAWRVWDIGSPEMPSLRAAIISENAGLAK
jgi:Protein of unknown function (DUF3828)